MSDVVFKPFVVKPKTAPGPWVQMMNPKQEMYVHEYDMDTTATVVGLKDPNTYIVEYKNKKYWSEVKEWEIVE